MAQVVSVDPVKLFMAILTNGRTEWNHIMDRLILHWGKIDYQSADYEFGLTDYYQKEMGEPLYRRFISFQALIPPEAIASIKRVTNRIEEEGMINGNRQFNLDPGYLDYQKIVLASMKFGGQKIHLHSGVYADLTLYYRKGSFTVFPWTFPDFKSDIYYPCLLRIRELYKQNRQQNPPE
ncbi:MAG: DUF4416 family protein [Candidatus Delongbacteria bacterium]|nr:DUF4416 family protein [Candidatus Delongbacteria bacterium]